MSYYMRCSIGFSFNPVLFLLLVNGASNVTVKGCVMIIEFHYTWKVMLRVNTQEKAHQAKKNPKNTDFLIQEFVNSFIMKILTWQNFLLWYSNHFIYYSFKSVISEYMLCIKFMSSPRWIP